jgi:hypothetical protein
MTKSVHGCFGHPYAPAINLNIAILLKSQLLYITPLV